MLYEVITLLHENSRRECVLRVVVVYGDDRLDDDGAGVYAFVKEMHGASYNFV